MQAPVSETMAPVALIGAMQVGDIRRMIASMYGVHAVDHPGLVLEPDRTR
jgi:hypothetical protein